MADRLSGAPARIAAAAIALAAWAGILIHIEALWTQSGSLFEALWIIGRYFTVLTNLIVAVQFTLIAFGRRSAANPRLIAATTLAIVLVGVVYGLLLHGLVELTAGAAVANVLLHRLTPLMVPLFWLFYVPKGTLRWSDPALWTGYPVVYLVYALARGAADGKYAYPFIDVAANGVAQVAITCAIIAVAFVAVGLAFVWLDRALASRQAPGI
jgi:hypothetical protein